MTHGISLFGKSIEPFERVRFHDNEALEVFGGRVNGTIINSEIPMRPVMPLVAGWHGQTLFVRVTHSGSVWIFKHHGQTEFVHATP